MAKVDVDECGTSQRSGRRLWYLAVMGLVAGAAVVAFGTLAQPIATIAIVVAVAIAIVFDRVTRRVAAPPMSGRQRPGVVAYLVILGVALVGSLLLAWTIGRDGASWLPWLLGLIVFIVALVGSWIPEQRSVRQPAVL